MPSVWMNCNIEQKEVCANTPNIADTLAKKRNVDPCTEKCSQRQLYYVVCKNLGEGYEKLNRECGYEDVIYHCGFEKGEFYAIMDDPTSYLETITDECHSEGSNVRDGVCSDNCRNVMKEYIDIVGCCFNFLNSTSFNVGSTAQVLSSDLFSACGIEVPNACNSFNSRAVPDDFLECAGRTINNNGATLEPGVYSIGLIIIGAWQFVKYGWNDCLLVSQLISQLTAESQCMCMILKFVFYPEVIGLKEMSSFPKKPNIQPNSSSNQ